VSVETINVKYASGATAPLAYLCLCVADIKSGKKSERREREERGMPPEATSEIVSDMRRFAADQFVLEICSANT
jgi:hypothetical protein